MKTLYQVFFIIILTASMLLGYSFSSTFKIPLKVGAILYSEEFLTGVEGLESGLKDLGYGDEKEVYFDVKVINGDLGKIPAIMEEFNNEGVKVLFVTTTPIAKKVMAINDKYKFQVVFNEVADPVLSGLVNTLDKPGRNFTGVSHAAFRMTPKRIQVATEFFNKTKTIYYLSGSVEKGLEGFDKQMHETERLLNIKIKVVDFNSKAYNEFVEYISNSDNSESIIVFGISPELVRNFNSLRDISYRASIPLIPMDASLVARGAAFTYAPEFYSIGRQSAYIMDMIFKGANASDIPVKLPDKIGIYINKTALKYFQNKYDRYYLYYAERCF
ncbi:ABC transporter substrate-binding protein [Deferribacterales bacterium Es71-Z0220]|uniref:ABC transporter substrate-binding protein n=1 Tax=Deferrivibrio essentukiensis TaxID=2880922 RepID=UPI001F620E0F|nr:ABC transporter substrate-binding protein [Deferrivibrio essentukiensis]MCB4203598.1 ABC transporter substrate-binding protein [Deferrivibrio essentukiensis]